MATRALSPEITAPYVLALRERLPKSRDAPVAASIEVTDITMPAESIADAQAHGRIIPIWKPA
ncbi:hypothetical protein [Sphingomonas quercus]|uniref:Uncharacterized protein n=1 Tax=Sphingomonas quercus TaxID=2842451 RepID=A0ABS6BJ25_9SPHN|nr:hypothetical protein [Sphingomonas quercus]MBU3077847.1 hypothetical protein [Sphingomonas quercus]